MEEQNEKDIEFYLNGSYGDFVPDSRLFGGK